MNHPSFRFSRLCIQTSCLFGLSAFLVGCSSENVVYDYPTSDRAPSGRAVKTSELENKETIFGPGGLDIFGQSSGQQPGSGGGGIGVNSYLWRASLDTMSFMPLNQADPFGGVIITDWFSPSESPNERFKMNIYILGTQLRADGVRVAVFRQVRGAVSWQDGQVDPLMGSRLEETILTRARQFRIEDAANE